MQSSYLAIVATSKGSDLRGVLDVLYELGSPASLEPFPLPMLNRLGALVGAEATQYGEFSLWEDGRSYSTDRSIESRGEPDWVSVNWHRLWQQDPISCHLNAGATKPLAISDRVSRRAFQRLEIFQDVIARSIRRIASGSTCPHQQARPGFSCSSTAVGVCRKECAICSICCGRTSFVIANSGAPRRASLRA